MAVTFTPEQTEAIDLHGCSILVSAAAGSGKTAVLAERIIRMVCDGDHPVDIDRLLVVTFTNAAAAEMRERISAGIGARLSLRPESEHLQRQAALLYNAQITTIDSFCLFLLRNHFNEIGLDPAFRIADEGEIKLLEQETIQELFEDSFEQGGEEFRFCVEFFCPGGKESVLERYILSLSHFAASFPWPREWLVRCAETYGEDGGSSAGDAPWKGYLLGHLKRMIGGCAEKMSRVLALCREPDGPYPYEDLAAEEVKKLEAAGQCETLEEFAQALSAITFDRLPAKKDASVNGEKRERAKEERAQIKKEIQELREKCFATPLKLAYAQDSACRKPVGTLIDLVLEFDRRMAEKKTERKIVDFSDMEHMALSILLEREGEQIRPSRVALEYRQHFAEILIDEYQDSNLVQEYLLQAVSGEEDGNFNRFMVGDVKQSIYKFRLARPELFLDKYRSYHPDRGNRRRIDLSRNFRSRFQVVDGVNQVFSRLMSGQTGGLEYDEKAALYAGADYPENPDADCELLLAQKPDAGSRLSAKQLEARMIAARIRRLLQEYQVTDRESGALRPARYSDMVILLRSLSGWDEEFRKELTDQGIPVSVVSRTGYFSASEVQEILQFLKALDNPTQDIPLFSVMRSVFGGFTPEEIAMIRSRRKGCSLYAALTAFAEEGGEAAEKTARFLETLQSYRKCSVYLSIRELLTKILTDFDYLNYVTALPAGGKRRANVEMLLTKASDFEKTSYFGLFHFVRYMEQLEKYEVDYGEAEFLDESADLVRMMSIHKSKGLEFPIVFVAGLSKRFNMQDVNRPLLADLDLGLGTDYVDPERRLKNKTLRRLALAVKLKEDSLSEELRVMYVAFTRAKEKLILTGVSDKALQQWESWRENAVDHLSYPDFMGAGSFLEMLFQVLGKTRIRVSAIREEDLQWEDAKEQFRLAESRERLNRLEHLEREEGSPQDREAYRELMERLNAPYLYAGLAGLYTKTTVSELKIAAMADRDEEAFHAFEEKEIQPYIPAFRREKESVTGAVRGNAYHKVMELLDFGALLGTRSFSPSGLEERLGAFLEDMTAKGRLSRQYRNVVQDRKIIRFLLGPLGQRMWRAALAGKLYREQPFVLGIDAKRLNPNLPEGETVLIQGIIDVFFEDGDGLVLLDYKTDSVASAKELWNRYETQMDYYQEALEKLTEKPVRERILYSFHLEQAMEQETEQQTEKEEI